MITEKELLAVKKRAEEGKLNLLKAEATMVEVKRNIEMYRRELSELGVDPERAEEELKKREDAIMEKYNAILAMFPLQGTSS